MVRGRSQNLTSNVDFHIADSVLLLLLVSVLSTRNTHDFVSDDVRRRASKSGSYRKYIEFTEEISGAAPPSTLWKKCTDKMNVRMHSCSRERFTGGGRFISSGIESQHIRSTGAHHLRCLTNRNDCARDLRAACRNKHQVEQHPVDWRSGPSPAPNPPAWY
jgi:hypothetical protein